MKEITNCPNCGAPIESHKCLYCGTIFYDFSEFEIGQPSYIRMKINGTLNVFRALLKFVDVTQDANEIIYADNTVFKIVNPTTTNLTMEFELLPDDKGVLLERYVK